MRHLLQDGVRAPALGLGAVEAQGQRQRLGEAGDEQFVLLGERRAVGPFAQVHASVNRAVVRHRHGEQAFHRRVVRREADGARVACHVIEAQRVIFLDDDAEQSLALRQAPDARGLFGGDAGVNELLQLAGFIDDADGAIARADQRGQRLDAFLQQLLFDAMDCQEVQQAQRGGVQVVQPLRIDRRPRIRRRGHGATALPMKRRVFRSVSIAGGGLNPLEI